LESSIAITCAGVESFDIDNDGDLDVVATDETNDLLPVSTNESGSFTESSIATQPAGPEINHVTDVNDDGFLDLLVSGAIGDSVSFFSNDSSSLLTEFEAGHEVFPFSGTYESLALRSLWLFKLNSCNTRRHSAHSGRVRHR